MRGKGSRQANKISTLQPRKRGGKGSGQVDIFSTLQSRERERAGGREADRQTYLVHCSQEREREEGGRGADR